MSDDIQDLIDELEGLGENFEESVTVTLNDLARSLGPEVTTEIFRVKQDQSHSLRGSIKSYVSGTNLTFEMNDYGYYQTFGVAGNRLTSVLGLPAGIAGAFGKFEGSNFYFSKIKHPGIKPVERAANILDNIDDILITEILKDIE